MAEIIVAETDWPPPALGLLESLRMRVSPRMGFEQERVVRGRCRLFSAPGTTEEIGGKLYLAHQWFDGYHISAECYLSPSAKGGYDFEALGIVVLESALAYGEMKPLFRVEWEHQDHPVGPHAQPHWHVYTAEVLTPVNRYFLVREEQGEWEPFADEVTEDAFPDSGEVSLERFHFGLAVRWGDPSNAEPHYSAPMSCDMGQWSTQCLQYIRSQLQYLQSGRAG